MAQFEQHFVQDLTQQIKVRHCGSIVFNADNESNVVSVRLFNGSEPVAISGSVVGAVVCSDGSTVPLTGSYSGNTASITLTGDCFAVLGQIGVGIQIVNGTQKTTVLKVIYNVETLTTENVVDPGSRITLEVGDLIAAIDEAVATIPEDYSALTSEVEDIKAVNKIFNRDVVGVPNPIDTATWIDNANLNDSGAVKAAQGWKVTQGYIETSADSYKISYNNSETSYIVQVAGYTSSGSFVRMFANAESSSGVRSFTIDTTSVDKIRIATRYRNSILSVYPNDGKIVEKLASVEDDVSDLKSQISGDQTEVTLSSENGYYIATNTGTLDLENPRSYYVNYRGKYALVPCAAGDVFFVTGKGANNHKPWATCNSTGTYIRTNGDNTVENLKITIAEGEAYLIYNGEDGSPAQLLKGLNAIEQIEIELAGTVRFDEAQTLTDAQKTQARSNIGAVDAAAIEDIEDAIHLPEVVALDSVNGYYIATNTGTIDPSSPLSYYVNYRGSYKFMAVTPGDYFRVTGTGANNHRPWALCKSDGTVTRTCSSNAVDSEVVIVAENEAYLAYNGETGHDIQLLKGTSAFEDLQSEIDAINRNTANPYKNMKAVAFGTSLTYRDLGYRPYLANDLGITIDNQGVGSAFWLTWQQDNSNILYNVQNYAGFADKDLCIIEGCTNDFGGNRTLGTYKDTGTDTVCGCLYNMISHVYTENHDIQIFVILDHFGRVYGSSDSSPAKVNTEGKTQYDYYEECAKLCAFYGIPCIKTYEFCNVGPFGTEYLYDNIHLNALGGQQVAQTIAKAMLGYKPKIIN